MSGNHCTYEEMSGQKEVSIGAEGALEGGYFACNKKYKEGKVLPEFTTVDVFTT